MGAEAYTIPYGNNHYCGPAALAYITRTHPDYAAALLRRVSKRKAIKGVTISMLVDVLFELKIEWQEFSPSRPPYPTLAQWLKRVPRGEYIICITGHWIVIDGDLLFDNKYHLGRHISRCPYLRRRVRSAWKIRSKSV